MSSLCSRHLAPSLVCVLARSPRLTYSSRVLDLSFQLPSSVGREEEEGGLWRKTDVLQLLHRQAEHLGQALARVTEQLEGVGRINLPQYLPQHHLSACSTHCLIHVHFRNCTVYV